MLKNLKRIIEILLLSIIFISNASHIIEAAYKLTEANIVQIGQAPYHLKYYNEEKGMYTYSICSIVGYYENNKFYPAYCLNRDLHGVGAVESYSVDIDSLIENNQIWRAVKNGYPYKTPQEMGLSSEFNAFAVTKFAIYCLTGQADINLYMAEENDTEGQAMLKALKKLVDIGQNGAQTFSNEIEIIQNENIEEEENYYSITYEVKAGDAISKYSIKTISGLTEQDIITDSEGKIKTTFNSGENFKVKISKNNLNSNKDINIEIEAELKNYPMFYGKTRISGTQDYLLTSSSYQNISKKINSKIELNTGKVILNKVDSKTKQPIEGVTFELYNSKNELILTKITDKEGKAEFINLYPGKYYLKETKTSEKYILDSNTNIEIDVKYNQTTTIDVENQPIEGQIQIIKKSSKESKIANIQENAPLEGIEFEIYDNNSKIVDKITTDQNGKAISKLLEKGTYKIKEKTTNKWYILDEKYYTAEINTNNQIVTLELENTPAEPEGEINKKGPDLVQAEEEFEYKVNVQNTGNVALQEFIWEDEIPTSHIRVTKIKLGKYNQENTYNLYYKTNFSNEYVLLYEDISTLNSEEIDFSKELSANEYITNIKLYFKTVDKGFKSETDTTIYAKVNLDVKHDDVFENKVKLTANYKGYKIEEKSNWKTKIYKLLPLTGI